MAVARNLLTFVASMIHVSLGLAAYSSYVSPDGDFMLEWKFMDGKLMFKATCDATGWCGVGFTETSDGLNMVEYDIAVGGYAGNQAYLKDYWSTSRTEPPVDTQQDYMITSAKEMGQKTEIEFYRNATTGDSKDVQFTENTTVWIVWAYHSTNDADSSLSQHSKTGRSSNRYNLRMVPEAESTTSNTTSTPTMSTTTVPTTDSSLQSLQSSDGKFTLTWKYMDNKLMFKATCMAVGWCGVGFTETDDGRSMRNYDIAVGGYASGQGYLKDYWSESLGLPPVDSQQDYKLTKASEMDGKTMLEFYRNAETGDSKDVQFKDDTMVWVVWASHDSFDADSSLSQHDHTGRSSMKYKLFMGTPNSANVLCPTLVVFLLFIFKVFF